METQLGGVGYVLNPAAVSAIRYRVAYGGSSIGHLAQCTTQKERQAILLRVVHMMIPPDKRPSIQAFARQMRRDADFCAKAEQAQRFLFSYDPLAPIGQESDGERFDEYNVLALMACAGLDIALIHEMPILHLAGLAGRVFELKDPNRKVLRKMTQEEMTQLYRRKKTTEVP